jgi:4-hydroxybenzoate polyprenyltransferase
MVAFLRLIRLPNLLIIALTQYLIRYGVLLPFFKVSQLHPGFSELDFFLLVLSTIFIAAAGYVINDYFDTRTDRINRPQSVVIDRGIKRRVAMALHVLFNFIGIGIGFYLGYKAGVYKLGMVHMFCAGILWFYSTDFKKQFLVGNIIVSLLTALVPMIVPVFEVPLGKTEARIEYYNKAEKMRQDTPQIITEQQALEIDYNETLARAADNNLNYAMKVIGLFALFAFLTSLAREVIKDMEDYEGDKATGCKTMPIVIGIKSTKYITMLFVLVTIAGLALVQQQRHSEGDQLSFMYLAVIQLLLLFLLVQLFRASQPVHFHRASMLVKIIMLVGVCYSLVIYYSLNAAMSA